MFVVLLCSAALVIIPIFFVQHERFLASLPAPKRSDQLLVPPAGLQAPRKRGNASFDSAASDTATEGPSEPFPARAVTTSGYERRETKKPWNPPFPMRSKTLREAYLILPRSEDEKRDEYKGKGKEQERRSTSQMPPDEEDGVLNIGHVPVTDLPSWSAPAPSPMRSAPAQVRESPTAIQGRPEARVASTQATPESTSATIERKRSLSLVQTIVLVFALIIFLFAFAILVAHCMAWFVVYKTEARLGEVRKGLLRGGDMRVCLCAR
ncbi:hypothetical protein P171DRAFT_523511 [Karstenula rhodostoma CBS 690.94]|uniref:Uncharacterized protein n=1 Tax=Karstenula rhodostoma CBS 690.94 TaxID=1392251 RepID=A0A9P4PDT2_9PLEO|nr:hypothetical protein P171DRAFT_523511 [Karstenula rhodostoma CBS 690.94]